MTRNLGRLMVAAVSLTVLQAVGRMALLSSLPAPPGGHSVGLAALVNLMTAALLLFLAVHMGSPGWRRVAALFLISWGIQARSGSRISCGDGWRASSWDGPRRHRR